MKLYIASVQTESDSDSVNLDVAINGNGNPLASNYDVYSSSESKSLIISSEESDYSLEIEEEEQDIEPPVLPQIDIVNYAQDIEIEEDYENNWCWLLQSDIDNCFSLPFSGQGGELNMSSVV